MAGKNSTPVLKVNLDCRCCYRKIRNAIYRLQDENIKTITYDKNNQTVSISGPFDNPENLENKLECTAGRVIKNVQIKKDPEKPKRADKATQTGVHFPEDVINAEKKKQRRRRLQQKERGDALKQPVTTDDEPPEGEAPRRPVKLVAGQLVPVVPCVWPPGGPCYEGHHGMCMYCNCPNYCGGAQGYGVPCSPAQPHRILQFSCEDEDDQPTGCAVM